MHRDLSSIKPFEICSIRPPTENYSLTFRLTRNCYWNRCGFCPVYKQGNRFSKRSLEAVAEDIQRARLINDLLSDYGYDKPHTSHDQRHRLFERIEAVRYTQKEHNSIEESTADTRPDDLDPRLAWFMPWFKDEPSLEQSIDHVLTWRMGGGKTCFLGDADALIIQPEFMRKTIEKIKRFFPSIERFTVYGRTKTAASIRTANDLKAYRDAGLDRVHFGVESGSDAVLSFINKGVTAQEHITAGIKTRESGLSCSVYIMPGLGGVQWSDEHAHETAAVISRMAPDYVRLRTLQVFPQTPLEQAVLTGKFIECTEEQIVCEIRIMIEKIDAETEIFSDSAVNLLNVTGKLPDDRQAMLAEIDRYLMMSERDKILFSIISRLQAFNGQYGGLSADIYDAVSPYLNKGTLDFSSASNDKLIRIIRLIRSKLMP